MTRDEILAVLEDGAFERLKGSPENLEVEFKREPYRLDQENQKFELAKDVSALANAAGGIIVIGVRTRADDQAAVDVSALLTSLRFRQAPARRRVDRALGSRCVPDSSRSTQSTTEADPTRRPLRQICHRQPVQPASLTVT